MKLKAVINPVSGRDAQRQATADAVKRLRRQGALRINDICYTTADGDWKIDAHIFEDADAVMVAGGDGTLHNTINRMKELGRTCPIAYLPAGTTNDFGYSMGLPRTAAGFCDMLAEPDMRQLDLGLAGEHYFHYVAAGGALPSLSYATNQRMKNKLGHAAYVLSALPMLPRALRGSRIQIVSAEMEREEEAILFLVANAGRVAGFSHIVPGASLDDGYLHVLVIRKTSPLAVPGLLQSVRKGEYANRPEVLLFKTKRVHITCEKDAGCGTIGLDGEKGGNLPASLEIIPRGLKLIVPRTSIAA